METVKLKASPEVYWKPCQTSEMENFAKTINSFQPFTIFTKHSITQTLHVWQSFDFRISSNKRPRRLFNFKTLRCTTSWRATLKRGRRLFQIKTNDLHENSKL